MKLAVLLVAGLLAVPAASQIASASATDNCMTRLLANPTFTCPLKFSDNATTEYVFNFGPNDPTTFRMTINGFQFRCSCLNQGNFDKPKFLTSNQFLCVKGDEGFEIALTGTAGAKGKSITRLNWMDGTGSSAIGSCHH